MATAASKPKNDGKEVKIYTYSWEGKDKSGKIVKGEMRASGDFAPTKHLPASR
jgi:type IV pilus assembly protein PilC